MRNKNHFKPGDIAWLVIDPTISYQIVPKENRKIVLVISTNGKRCNILADEMITKQVYHFNLEKISVPWTDEAVQVAKDSGIEKRKEREERRLAKECSYSSVGSEYVLGKNETSDRSRLGAPI